MDGFLHHCQEDKDYTKSVISRTWHEYDSGIVVCTIWLGHSFAGAHCRNVCYCEHNVLEGYDASMHSSALARHFFTAYIYIYMGFVSFWNIQ